MRRLIISRVSLMKCLGFVLLFGFITLGAIVGCNNNGGGEGSTRALTENDFAKDPDLRADPEGGVIVKFLEHSESDIPENDTGEIGSDTIPYRYTRTLENTFCWEDDDGEARHFMELDDSEGNEIFRLDVNGDCMTVVLEPGDYLMHIHHDGRVETTHAIFIIPKQNGDIRSKKEEKIPGRVIQKASRFLSIILEKLDMGVTKTTHAQSVGQNENTLLKTGSCEGCFLSGVDLTRVSLLGVNLTDADLSFANLSESLMVEWNLTRATMVGANLVDSDLALNFTAPSVMTDANLNSADLSGANLSSVDLSGANLSKALLVNADLPDVDLSKALLVNADLSKADLSKALLVDSDLTDSDLSGALLVEVNLTRTDLRGADLSGANLFDAKYSFTDLTGATWCCCDCLCHDSSCTGCPPAELCTSH